MKTLVGGKVILIHEKWTLIKYDVNHAGGFDGGDILHDCSDEKWNFYGLLEGYPTCTRCGEKAPEHLVATMTFMDFNPNAHH